MPSNTIPGTLMRNKHIQDLHAVLASVAPSVRFPFSVIDLSILLFSFAFDFVHIDIVFHLVDIRHLLQFIRSFCI